MANNAPKSDQTDVLVVGTGYLGRTVARLLMDHSGSGTVKNDLFAAPKIYATTRNRRRFPELSKSGFLPVQLDWTDRRTLGNVPWDSLSPGTRVLIAVSYDRKSRLGRYESQVGGLANLMSFLPQDARICYISTTGVYHQTDGSWVDETSPTHPSRVGGRAHLMAEQLLHRMRPFASWNILRLAGIYGPGRVPRAAHVIAGKPIESPATGYLNLIHVHDAARAVIASWDRMRERAEKLADGRRTSAGMQSRLYTVADNSPVVRGDFYREIARQCHAAEPKFRSPAKDAPVKMRSDSNKRVCNHKMRRNLVTKLTYPDYRAGLADVLTDWQR